MTDTLTVHSQSTGSKRRQPSTQVALVGNPNAGKTSLFNSLTGIRAKTANFPGTTVELREGRLRVAPDEISLLDLPGMYSLQPSTPDETVARDILLGPDKPDVVVAVVDATNLERNLLFASQLMELDVPVIIALTMMDLVHHRGIVVDVDALHKELRCPVIPVSVRTGQGLDALADAIAGESAPKREEPLSLCDSCRGCPLTARHRWSRELCARSLRAPRGALHQHTERIDHWLTHPTFGLLIFIGVMMAVFFLIFQVAELPMEWIETLFGGAGSLITDWLPNGWFRDLLVNGIIAGVGGVLVFLPQICLLFFMLALLEDTGYLARAALVMDRWMKKVGLPGKAFVPLLSAHACAIPAIMATRVLEQPRDRLVTILVAPLLSCAARLPVYIMIAGLLVPGAPFKAALLLSSAYLVGIAAALGAAFVFRHTILPGKHQPLVIELPEYRRPDLRTALLHTLDRGTIFIQQAGTLILVFSMIMWFLAAFPRHAEPTADSAGSTEHSSPALVMAHAPVPAGSSDGESTRPPIELSYAGRLGQFIEPVIRPLGFDWRIGIGLISSFAAREVLVSTMAIVYRMEGEDEGSDTFLGTLRSSQRADGSPVFTVATCMSLLVFYILAAQCIPTQIITRRETGSWKWAILQFSYMNGLAYIAAWLTYQGLSLAGG